MNRLFTYSILILAFFGVSKGFSQCTNLFFSEYLEGSSNNKALEIYNASSATVNLSRYQVRRFNNGGLTAAVFKLNGTLAPGAVYVIGNPQAIASILAVSDTTGDATFFNGDDAVALIDTTIADTVDIIGIIGNDPGTNWVVGSGTTSEFTLVRLASVQEGTTNWALGATQWTVLPQNTVDSLGDHYMIPCGGVVTPSTVNFSAATASIAEAGGSVSVSLTITPVAANCSVKVSLSPVGTATAGADFTFSSPDTVIFTASGSSVATLVIPINSDQLTEPTETFTLRVDSLSGCPVGATDSVKVQILDDDIPTPVYPIGLITADANADGVADSLNVICEVRGVVYGVDLRGGNGVQFVLRGQGHGIGVFTTLATVGYDVVAEGDSLHVIGKVEQFNGLAQIGTIDTIIKKAAARPLQAPVVVAALGENTESELVTIECVTLVNPSQWTGTGSGFTAAITNGTSTFDLRVDNDVTLYSQPAPVGYFSVTGLGGQFDSSVPRTSGYQLLPRYIADLVVAPAPVVSLERGTLSVVEQNTTISTDVVFSGLNPDSTEVWVYLAAAASTATAGLDFTFANDTLYKDGVCGSPGLDSVTVTILDDGLVEGNETVVLYIAAVVNGVVGAVDTVTITITDNATDAVSDLLPADVISLYPNPGRTQVTVEGSVRIESIRMTELSGKVVLARQVNDFQATLSTEALSGGVYLIEAATAQGRWIQKWVKVQP